MLGRHWEAVAFSVPARTGNKSCRAGGWVWCNWEGMCLLLVIAEAAGGVGNLQLQLRVAASAGGCRSLRERVQSQSSRSCSARSSGEQAGRMTREETSAGIH